MHMSSFISLLDSLPLSLDHSPPLPSTPPVHSATVFKFTSACKFISYKLLYLPLQMKLQRQSSTAEGDGESSEGTPAVTKHEKGRATPSNMPLVDAGPKKSDAGPKKSDAGPKKSDSGAKKSDAGAKKSDAGAKKSDSGPKKSDTGPKKSDSGPRKSDAGPKKSDAGAKKSDALTTSPVQNTSKTMEQAVNSQTVAVNHKPAHSSPGGGGGAEERRSSLKPKTGHDGVIQNGHDLSVKGRSDRPSEESSNPHPDVSQPRNEDTPTPQSLEPTRSSSTEKPPEVVQTVHQSQTDVPHESTHPPTVNGSNKKKTVRGKVKMKLQLHEMVDGNVVKCKLMTHAGMVNFKFSMEYDKPQEIFQKLVSYKLLVSRVLLSTCVHMFSYLPSPFPSPPFFLFPPSSSSPSLLFPPFSPLLPPPISPLLPPPSPPSSPVPLPPPPSSFSR